MTAFAVPASDSPTRTAGYWATTTPVAAILVYGGAADVRRTPYVRGVIEHLGYPAYFLVILGVWKLAGAAVLLAPLRPWVKEWAYAGAVFTFTGAVASHVAVGDSATASLPAAALAVLAVASRALRPPTRRTRAGLT